MLAAFCRFLPLPHWPICCNERQKAGEPPPSSFMNDPYSDIDVNQSPDIDVNQSPDIDVNLSPDVNQFQSPDLRIFKNG